MPIIRFTTSRDFKASLKKRETVSEKIRKFNGGEICTADESVESCGLLEHSGAKVAFISNFRQFRDGQKGKQHEYKGLPILLIKGMPEEIPLADLDGLIELLKEYRDFGNELIAQAKADDLREREEAMRIATNPKPVVLP